MTDLTIVIPVYNEAPTISSVIDRVLRSRRSDWQIIVVDDGSTDETPSILKSIQSDEFEFVLNPENQGKTAAVLTGLSMAKGKWVIVQDADLEYDPAEIGTLLDAASNDSPVVYGRRPSCWEMPSRWILASGVLFFDLCLLVVYRRWVRDHASCYKLVPRDALRSFNLCSTGFEGCIEITAKLMRTGVSISQVPISYSPRRADEGKKLTVAYGWEALRSVWRWRRWRLPDPASQPALAEKQFGHVDGGHTVPQPAELAEPLRTRSLQ